MFLMLSNDNKIGANGNIDITSKIVSPDGNHESIIYLHEGGGAAGYSYRNVTLIRKGDEISQSEPLFQYKHPSWNSCTNFKLHWVDAKNLNVSYKFSVTNTKAHKENFIGTVSE